MPGRDGSGPTFAGPGTGRGMGYCSGYPGNRRPRRIGGFGRGCGRGFGWGRGYGLGSEYGFGTGQIVPSPANANLRQYKNYLEEELKRVKQELEDNE